MRELLLVEWTGCLLGGAFCVVWCQGISREKTKNSNIGFYSEDTKKLSAEFITDGFVECGRVKSITRRAMQLKYIYYGP